MVDYGAAGTNGSATVCQMNESAAIAQHCFSVDLCTGTVLLICIDQHLTHCCDECS